MARITRSSSQFGVELDSLADVVSFGAAPSFMVYQAYLYTLGNWGIMIAALPVVFGAIRLARFNVQLVGFDKITSMDYRFRCRRSPHVHSFFNTMAMVLV